MMINVFLYSSSKFYISLWRRVLSWLLSSLGISLTASKKMLILPSFNILSPMLLSTPILLKILCFKEMFLSVSSPNGI